MLGNLARIATLLGILLGLTAPADASRIYTAEVRGPIFTPVLQYFEIALDQAKAGGADALLVEPRAHPGGSLTTTKDLVQRILGAPVPVIVYVSPSGGATSAGTFVTLAAHVAAMAPGTTIGAAHPVSSCRTASRTK
jgi:membrane-bound serine protease (ClpP class)